MNTDNTQEIEQPYEMIGYIASAIYPNIITGCILQNKSTGGQFRASILECQKLISDKMLKIPEL